jgi:hypothetical protein
MFKSLTYKTKLSLLLVGFLMVLVLGYNYSFSDTFKLMDGIEISESRLQWLKEKEREIPAIQESMQAFEKEFTSKDSLPVRDNLTAYISDYAEKNNCLVTEIPGNSFYKNNSLKVQTNVFTIKGTYRNLVLLLNLLEEKFTFMSKVMSARFYGITNPQNKRVELFLTIITQSFEQKQ